MQQVHVLFFGFIVDIYPEVYKMVPLNANWDEASKLWRTNLNTHALAYVQQHSGLEFQVKKLALQFLIHSLGVVFPLTQDLEIVQEALQGLWDRNSLLLTRTVRSWNSSSDIDDSTETAEEDCMEVDCHDAPLPCESMVVFEDGTKIYYDHLNLPPRSVSIEPGLFEMATNIHSGGASAIVSMFKGSYFQPYHAELAKVGGDLVKQINGYLTSKNWIWDGFTLDDLQEHMELVFLAALKRTVNNPYTTKRKVSLHRYNTGEFELSHTAKPTAFRHNDELYVSDPVVISGHVAPIQMPSLARVLCTLLLTMSRMNGCRPLRTVYKFFRRCVYAAITQLLLNNQMRRR
jgi:hypothetical protein